jgi:hypothetical protein
MLVTVTLQGILGGAELVADVAVVAGRDVGQVLGLYVALYGAVVPGGVAAHRTLQRAVCMPTRATAAYPACYPRHCPMKRPVFVFHLLTPHPPLKISRDFNLTLPDCPKIISEFLS